MKDKITVLVLIVVLVALLVICNNFLNTQENVDTNIIDRNTSNISEDNSINEIVQNNSMEENNMSGEILEVTSENFQKEVLESEKTVLIDFYAGWCGPCKRLSPIVEEVAGEEENIKVVKLNIDESEDLAIQYQVMSIPTLVVIKDGKEVNRSVGLIDKEEVKELVK